MAVDHTRVAKEVERLDNLLHEARLALKAKSSHETYLRALYETQSIIKDVAEDMEELILQLGGVR